jgi:hypothetical protein
MLQNTITSKVVYVGSTTSPQGANSVASLVSPPRNTGKEAIQRVLPNNIYLFCIFHAILLFHHPSSF